MCLLYDGSTRRLTESGFMWFNGFMEKPGIEPATPGLQGIVLIHYTTGASDKGSFTRGSVTDPERVQGVRLPPFLNIL